MPEMPNFYYLPSAPPGLPRLACIARTTLPQRDYFAGASMAWRACAFPPSLLTLSCPSFSGHDWPAFCLLPLLT